MNWREYAEDEEQPEMPWRDRGAVLERVIGWVLAYPVRTLIAALILVMFLTFACGL